MGREVGGGKGDKFVGGGGFSVTATTVASAIAVVCFSAVCDCAAAVDVCSDQERCLDGYHARLSAGSSGFLELHLPIERKLDMHAERPLWSRVCNDQPTAFSVQAAVVACRQIGLNRGALVRDRADIDSNVVGSEALWWKDLHCRGDEAELGKCRLGNVKKLRCFSFVHVVCAPAFEKEKLWRQNLQSKLLTQTKEVAKLTEDLADATQARQLLETEKKILKQAVANLQQQLQDATSMHSRCESSAAFDAQNKDESHCAAVDDSAFSQCRHDLAEHAKVLAAEREQQSAELAKVEMSQAKFRKELAAEREQNAMKLAQVRTEEREQASAKLAQALAAEREMAESKFAQFLALEREQAQAKLVKEVASERDQGLTGLELVQAAEREQMLAAGTQAAFAVVTLFLIVLLCRFALQFLAPLSSSLSAKEEDGSAQGKTSLSPPLSTHLGYQNGGDIDNVTSTTCGSGDESSGEFAFCTRDKRTDYGITRVITVQCPGVDHSGVNIEIIFNGCVISLKRPESSGLKKALWKKRFDFEVSDGLFEFKEDQAQLENGVLQVVFSFHSRMFRFPKLGKRDSTDIDYCRWMNESDLSDESSSLSEIQQREGPQRFDISSQKVESVTSQSDIAAGIISDSASVYSSWSACAIDTK
eukprot:TRINITY_DN7024_c0_g2_i1.p1 TRINITY_DN7024_c0_g2~~TRINITY_DN7024_c0_g2_i1.p1  ORF type:complete len:646 (+),score=121.54 TRINITY_DN7024_c0_g2_i1:130-2067(+)